MNFAEGRDDKIAELNRILSRGGAVLFTGAGFSVPSGIPDFRSQGGIYHTSAGGRSAEYMLSHECLVEHPDEFFAFYKTKMIYPNAKPNAAHVKFAELEKAGFVDAVVTQNIDGLHQAAGSRKVWELHGSVERNYCASCGKRYDLKYVLECNGVPECSRCGGTVRPEVVLYGECLDERTLAGAIDAVQKARTLIVAGTSLSVYPAAGLVDLFEGENLVLINKTPTPKDGLATLAIYGDVAEVAKRIEVSK